MALFGRSDLPLRRDAAGSFIPWLVAVLVFVAAIAATVNAYTAALLDHWNRSVVGTLTVQVPPPIETGASDKSGAPGRESAAALGVLKIHPDVVRAAIVPRAKVLALLEPWLGGGEAVADLPLPALIDVELRAGADVRAVSDAILKAAPTALIDDHRVWLSRVTNLAEGIGLIALALMALIGAALGLTVVFATRASLAEFAQVIEVLHLVGARDGYIARQFARRALAQAVFGGLAGLLAFAPVLAFVAWRGSHIDRGILPDVALPPWHWAVLATLPLVAGVLAMASAHATVRRALHQMP
jgi:cell division transport system permease protein